MKGFRFNTGDTIMIGDGRRLPYTIIKKEKLGYTLQSPRTRAYRAWINNEDAIRFNIDLVRDFGINRIFET
jgi:hypothetical protein